MGLNAKYQDKFCLTVLGPHQWAHSAQISSEMTRMGSMLLIHTFSSRLKLPMATGMALSLYHGMMLRICPNLAWIFPFFLCTERMFWEGGKKKTGGLWGLYDISIESICSKLCFHAIFRPCKSVQFFADLGKLGYANEIKVLICEGGSEDPLQPKSVRIRLLSLC